MNIQSTLLLAADGKDPLPVFNLHVDRSDAVIDIIATLVLGSVRERNISDEAQACLDRFMDVHKTAYPDAVVRIVDIDSLGKTDELITRPLEKISRGDAIAYFCRTPTILKRAIKTLGL